MSGKGKAMIATALTCALLIAAAAVVVSILALSDGKGDKDAVQAEGGSRQVQKERGQDEGGEMPPASGKEGQTGVDSGATGQKPKDSQPEEPSGTTSYPGLVPTQIPASSVDEALLRQAALDYMAHSLGGTEAYQITQVKISAIDPAWGKVTFYSQDQDLTIETLFYKQNGNWAPIQPGQGTPAMPTDL